MAVYVPLPALIALNQGWTPKSIGIIATLMSFGTLFSNWVWPKYVAASKKVGALSLGFISILLGSLLLQNPSTLILAIIILSVFPSLAYHTLLNEVKNDKGSLSENVAMFHQSTSSGNLFGLIIGVFCSQFFSIEQLPFILFVVALLSTLLISSLIDIEGLFPIFVGGFNEIKKVNSHIRKKRKRERDTSYVKTFIPYLILSSLFSLSLSTIGAQFTTIIKFLFLDPSLYYLFAIVLEIGIILTYKISGKVGNKALPLAIILRFLACLSLIFTISNKWMFISYALLTGITWGFINTFYSTINLQTNENILSLNRTLRSVSYMFGSYFSGTFFQIGGLFLSSIISMSFILLAIIPSFLAQKALKCPSSEK